MENDFVLSLRMQVNLLTKDDIGAYVHLSEFLHSFKCLNTHAVICH